MATLNLAVSSVDPSAPDGWLSRRRGRMRQEEGDDELVESNGTPLPDDALGAIFARFPDAADVVRCSATCRRWARVAVNEAAALAGALPPEIARCRALLGLFHQEDPGVTAPRKRKRSSAGGTGQPRFVPTAAAARLLGFRSPATMSDVDGASLEYSRPVASRNGRVVLELRREGHADGLRLCVFNPMTGDVAQLPPLSGKDKPAFYACALLTGDDLLTTTATPPPAVFFRVLIVYNRRGFTAFRAYSSDTNRWSLEAARSKIDDGRMRKLGQSVVLRGVAYWPLQRSALAVRLDGPEPAEVSMPADGVLSDLPRRYRLLGVTPGGTKQQQLCFVDASYRFDRRLRRAGLPFRSIVLSTKILHTGDGDDDYDMSNARWEVKGRIMLLEIKVGRCDNMDLRWFCERSGVIFFTVGEDSSSPGAYALNVETEEVEKVAHGADCHSWWKNVVGYEMDAAGCLASSIPCY